MKNFVPALVAISSVAVLVAANGNATTANEALAATPPHEDLSGPVQCFLGPDGVAQWYYNSRGEGPYRCTIEHDSYPWSMLSAYRAGGQEGVHWKYTDNVNDGECLENWKYYSDDGQTLIAWIPLRTTTQNDSRRWCALPVYRKGGVRGKQWDYCLCRPQAARQ